MQVVVSKNAFGLFGAMVAMSILLGLYFLIFIAGVPGWIAFPAALLIRLSVEPIVKRWPKLGDIFGEPRSDTVRLGRLTFKLLPPPKLTRQRTLILCVVFVVWLIAIIESIVYWYSYKYTIIVMLPIAVITSTLLLHVIEKRWQS
jgi:hypothetical protein